MRKLRLERTDVVTFREGCERYLNDCRTRNLREGTIGHYRQSYVQFYKFYKVLQVLRSRNAPCKFTGIMLYSGRRSLQSFDRTNYSYIAEVGKRQQAEGLYEKTRKKN